MHDPKANQRRPLARSNQSQNCLRLDCTEGSITLVNDLDPGVVSFRVRVGDSSLCLEMDDDAARALGEWLLRRYRDQTAERRWQILCSRADDTPGLQQLIESIESDARV